MSIPVDLRGQTATGALAGRVRVFGALGYYGLPYLTRRNMSNCDSRLRYSLTAGKVEA